MSVYKSLAARLLSSGLVERMGVKQSKYICRAMLIKWLNKMVRSEVRTQNVIFRYVPILIGAFLPVTKIWLPFTELLLVGCSAQKVRTEMTVFRCAPIY